MQERLVSQMTRIFIALGAVALLAGCAPPTIGSITGGECQLTHTPEYAVKGQTAYDQKWVNKTVEAQVVGCKQPRPKPRPAGWSTHTVAGKTVPVPPPAVKEPEVIPTALPQTISPPAKKPPIWKRIFKRDQGAK
jgi:hypothetical protein